MALRATRSISDTAFEGLGMWLQRAEFADQVERAVGEGEAHRIAFDQLIGGQPLGVPDPAKLWRGFNADRRNAGRLAVEFHQAAAGAAADIQNRCDAELLEQRDHDLQGEVVLVVLMQMCIVIAIRGLGIVGALNLDGFLRCSIDRVHGCRSPWVQFGPLRSAGLFALRGPRLQAPSMLPEGLRPARTARTTLLWGQIR